MKEISKVFDWTKQSETCIRHEVPKGFFMLLWVTLPEVHDIYYTTYTSGGEHLNPENNLLGEQDQAWEERR